ncbi:CD225/dispanin family protein [Mariniphaga sediminis]|jgi:hypothetical protein|uniref:CD225/dispanin family protein n=1 Tax=Mariniphaga sediminis TaxID=1628158 RepID=A0A399D4Y9_9BACT|nr:CD225/dispanin family protein [Mariniphaga sediminis]MBD3621790.1 CD225/dispanin family protein [Sunxiuqinia sp.]RIH66248.1 CD225/dispanin family protein [Mariniphaga sediminis]
MNEQQEQQPQVSQQAPPSNYLVWAILTTILCCLPFGIVSIVYAAQVNTKWQAGDYDGAKISSKNAKLWAWVSFGAALAGMLLWLLLVIFGVVAGLGLGALDSLSV